MKMTVAVKVLVEQQMSDDDETTVAQLHALRYSTPNRFEVILSATNCSRTVRPFHLNGEGVSYNGKAL